MSDSENIFENSDNESLDIDIEDLKIPDSDPEPEPEPEPELAPVPKQKRKRVISQEHKQKLIENLKKGRIKSIESRRRNKLIREAKKKKQIEEDNLLLAETMIEPKKNEELMKQNEELNKKLEEMKKKFQSLNVQAQPVAQPSAAPVPPAQPVKIEPPKKTFISKTRGMSIWDKLRD
jgi:hypothetical protein